MASVNKVILIGNLGQDPEVRYLPNGDAVANVSLATNERWKDKEGNAQEKVEWHRVIVYGKLAEVVGEYLKKGSQAYFEGKLQTRKWTDKQGVEKYTTEIIAHQLVMLGSKASSEGRPPEPPPVGEKTAKDSAKEYAAASGGSAKRAAPAKDKGKTGFDDLEDDVPF